MCLFSAKCRSGARLDGKTAIVTGANSGIGKTTVHDFYTRGCRVIMACRDVQKAKLAAGEIKKACKDLENLGTILVVELDLSGLKSIRDCAARLLESEVRIDLLINNAGVMMCPEGRTEDGFETQIGTNHLGHFLFTMLLLPRICQGTAARIVNVASVAHDSNRIDLDDLNWEKKVYNSLSSYQQSKLANILFTKELARRLEGKGSLQVVKLDLSSLKSVRNCATSLLETEERIDLLINNAGVLMRTYDKTEDGFEMDIGTNHLGHFLFTMLLLPTIIQSAPARIVNVSSVAHFGFRIDLEDLNFERKKYRAAISYQQSKLANILFARELARRLKENGIFDVTTYSLHPGCIQTDIMDDVESLFGISIFFFRHVVRRFLKTPQQGAQTTIYCAVDEKCAHESGLYYSECSVTTPFRNASYETDARRLWDLSWKLVGLDEKYDPFATCSKL